jgi:hypothetical protein
MGRKKEESLAGGGLADGAGCRNLPEAGPWMGSQKRQGLRGDCDVVPAGRFLLVFAGLVLAGTMHGVPRVRHASLPALQPGAGPVTFTIGMVVMGLTGENSLWTLTTPFPNVLNPLSSGI